MDQLPWPLLDIRQVAALCASKMWNATGTHSANGVCAAAALPELLQRYPWSLLLQAAAAHCFQESVRWAGAGALGNGRRGRRGRSGGWVSCGDGPCPVRVSVWNALGKFMHSRRGQGVESSATTLDCTNRVLRTSAPG